MITKEQYDKALKIVRAYEQQQKRKKSTSILYTHKFTDDDLSYSVRGSISIDILTDDIVDENFARWLDDELTNLDHTVEWVSLYDMGYITILFLDNKVTQERIDDVLKILNSYKNKK